MAVGNEEQMAKVRELMQQKNTTELGSSINAGSENTFTWEMDFTSLEGKQYKGTFVFKKLNIRDSLRIGGIKSELLRSYGVTNMSLVDPGMLILLEAVSALTVGIVRCPSWLLNEDGKVDVQKLETYDVIFAIYDVYDSWLDSFRKSRTSESDADSETAGPTETMANQEDLR